MICGATIRESFEPPGSEYVKYDTLFILFSLSSEIFVFFCIFTFRNSDLSSARKINSFSEC